MPRPPKGSRPVGRPKSALPTYREMFFIENGRGPWPCYGCGEDVHIEKVHIHHIDHNHSNDTLTNLAPMHQGCHLRHHKLGSTIPPELRERLRLLNTGKKLSAESRRKISEANKGKVKPRTAEHSRVLGLALRGVPRNVRLWQCDECTMISTTRGLDSHQSSSGHQGRFDTGKRKHDDG